ncbi:unnamed protein product [Bursaphelenchus okinawaensis]|uniref:C2H2-type domain-containing protein n=1 Tax=Bursaphelenchus okinawaensis TaxID=465554 RepID=A0A811JTJ4_9BILA|nr:unnamed protein product [Bursaphelenchus okinawaensis]CAG9082519.1 unnamed protein product [Bursaphelenchus okinawaensis]
MKIARIKTTEQNLKKSRWRCKICSKFLSSKRSYDEHLNVHNDARPFSCDVCDFAAASQMTLRRHRLRNHLPRSEWGYHCPHCSEAFMEPASYQQHVANRHPGLSAKFGCTICDFSSYCSRHFKEHYNKHSQVISRRQWKAPDSIYLNLAEFLIDDNGGKGYGDVDVYDSSSRLKLPADNFVFNGDISNGDSLDDYFKTALKTPELATGRSNIDSVPRNVSHNISCPPVEVVDNSFIGWVQNEVVIDSEADVSRLNGFIDEELD